MSNILLTNFDITYLPYSKPAMLSHHCDVINCADFMIHLLICLISPVSSNQIVRLYSRFTNPDKSDQGFLKIADPWVGHQSLERSNISSSFSRDWLWHGQLSSVYEDTCQVQASEKWMRWKINWMTERRNLNVSVPFYSCPLYFYPLYKLWV